MPELPEVETVRLQLLHKLVGKQIETVEILHNKSAGHAPEVFEQLIKKTIRHIDRVGKLLIFSFVESEELFMLAHLKMTGQFFYLEHDGVVAGGGHSLDDKTLLNNEWPHKHTRIIMTLSDHTTLYFNDMRLFGYMKVVSKSEKDRIVGMFGPEPHMSSFDDEAFFEALSKRRRVIKAVLLDQTLVAGLGNIYVDEVLYAAKISPLRLANTLSKAEVLRLRKAAGNILEAAVKAGGTTFQSFKDANGKRGNYLQKLKVFGKQGQKCKRCGHLIEKMRVAGRGTHWCPGCQR